MNWGRGSKEFGEDNSWDFAHSVVIAGGEVALGIESVGMRVERIRRERFGLGRGYVGASGGGLKCSL